MLKLEEYIYKRKKEDGINELDINSRAEYTRICVNYVFEYFNNYLETRAADEQTVLHEEKVSKYRNMISDYNPDVQDWLVSLYSSYGKHMHRNIPTFITDTYFLLYDSESEFRALSYEIYPKIVKKYRFIEGQSEMVFQFIKEYYRIENSYYQNGDYHICESINEWIDSTYKKYGVNLLRFCYKWAMDFYDNPKLWPKGHKLKSEYYDKYKNEPYSRLYRHY